MKILVTINCKLTQICIQWQNLASLETRSVFKQTWPMSQWLEQMQNWVQNPDRWHRCHLLFLHWYICKNLSPSDLIHFKSESPLTMIYFNVSLNPSFFAQRGISLRSDGMQIHNLSRCISLLDVPLVFFQLESRRTTPWLIRCWCYCCRCCQCFSARF